MELLSIIQQSTEAARDLTDNSPALILWTSLYIPLILLFIFSAIKYVVAIVRKNIRWGYMLAEIPIDLLSIFSSLILCKYIIPSPNILTTAIFFFAVLVSIFLAIIGCVMRCWIHDKIDESAPEYCKIILGTISMYIISGIWLITIFTIPSWITQ